MNRFVLIALGFGLPLLGFLVLSDGVSSLYRMPESDGLAYVVVEPEEVAEEEEAPVDEADPAAEGTATEEEAPVEEAPADEAVTEAEPETPAVQVAEVGFDMEAASRAVRKCVACHQLERERNGVGPHLVGVIGRQIGSVDGYRYSDALLALSEEGAVWDEAAIVEWLENPAAYAAGTKMNFKVGPEEDRRLIASWLATNPG